MIEKIRAIVSPNAIIKVNEEMKNHTTFRVGGEADFLVIPYDLNDVIAIRKFTKKNNIPLTVIGNGSNLLVKDGGIRGIVLKISNVLNEIKITDTDIEVGAGLRLTKLAKIAMESSLTGLEWANGIPGTVGGAVMMNAGAYGGEMSQVIVETKYLTEDGTIKTLTNEEQKFGYRSSVFTDEINGIIISVKIHLDKANIEKITEKMTDYIERRKEKQPLEFPSAGSTFKRPQDNFAGKLIEDAGLKGYTVGGACVSDKHAGFVINKDNATAQDILSLIENVKAKVKEISGVDLEEEVKIIGEA